MPEVVPTIPIGDSAEWILKITNQDTTPVDPTAAIGFAVFLFDAKGKLFAKYSNNELNTFINTLGIYNSNEGEILMRWEGSETKKFPGGEVYWQYMQQVENDTFSTDGKFTAKSLKKRLCIMEDTEAKHTTVLI